jgi:hypothetical protein
LRHTAEQDVSIAEALRRADALTLVEERRFEDLHAAFAEHADELASDARKALEAGGRRSSRPSGAVPRPGCAASTTKATARSRTRTAR